MSAPRWVIARHVFRSTRRGALIWGAVFGLFVVATVQGFIVGYPTFESRQAVAGTLGSFAILLGQPRHVDAINGFTQWRVAVSIALIGSIWALLVSTNALRGEEDAGRWELLLAGPVTKLRATAEALAGLGASLGLMFALTAVVTLAAGRFPGAHFSVPASLSFALSLVAGAAMFLAIGALASQLSATRGQAATLAAAVAGISFLVRMVGDSQPDLDWLLWVSPFGWVEQIRALRDPQPIAFAPVFALVAGCVAATLVMAKRRDLGASVLREGASAAREPRWLLGPTTLAIRLTRTSAIGWIVGLALFAFFTGTIARSFAALLASSPAFAAVLARLGLRNLSEAFLGISFFQLALVLAIVVASQMAALRDEEATGRLDNLLVRPVRRVVWLAGRVAVAGGLALACGLASGFFMWFGAATRHTGVQLSKLLEAGVNATVPAVFVLGFGVLVFGLRPRLTAAAAYGIVAYSFLVNLVGSLVSGQDWIRDSSIFSHIEFAPAAKPDWLEAAALVAIGLALAAIGAVAFTRRDVEYA